MNTIKLTLFIVLVGCASTDGIHRSERRYVNHGEGFSIDQPDGWSTSMDRGSVRFAPTSGKQTLVVRSAARPPEIVEGRPASNDEIVAAAERVLKAMPQAKVGAHTPLKGGELAAFSSR